MMQLGKDSKEIEILVNFEERKQSAGELVPIGGSQV